MDNRNRDGLLKHSESLSNVSWSQLSDAELRFAIRWNSIIVKGIVEATDSAAKRELMRWMI